MPRPKRTVGFWSGLPQRSRKPSLGPPPDRFTNTPVDAWPKAYRNALRQELLRRRKERPSETDEDLLLHARKWNASRPRPAGVAKNLSLKHIRVLLSPPPTRTKRPANPGNRRREPPRPTQLAPEALAGVLASQIKPRPLSRNKRRRRVAEDVHSLTGVEITAVWVPPDRMRVSWSPLPEGSRVRIDLRDVAGDRVRRVSAEQSVGSIVIGRVSRGPKPSTIELRATMGGRPIAYGHVQLLNSLRT